MFRNLRADEIEVRVQSVKEKGAVLLLYKNARVDMAILDETVKPFNWQREHKEVNGVVYCGVAINENYIEPSLPANWVWKWDAGSESQTEKEKGQASDSFKRACFNWGIGRELYTSPFTWVGADKMNIYKKQNGSFATKDSFHVEAIVIELDVITKLSIKNQKGERVFVWQK